MLIILDKGPNLDENALKLAISSFWKNLTNIKAKKYTTIHKNIPGNKNKVVFGIMYATAPIIAEAINILAIDPTGALVFVNLNTKYTHGTIIKKQATLVASAPPAIPRVGTITQFNIPVTIAPPTKIYIGILGFPIP